MIVLISVISSISVINKTENLLLGSVPDAVYELAHLFFTVFL